MLGPLFVPAKNGTGLLRRSEWKAQDQNVVGNGPLDGSQKCLIVLMSAALTRTSQQEVLSIHISSVSSRLASRVVKASN